jgi:hypothetical protein
MVRFDKDLIRGGVIATTFGNGPFHPAFKVNNQVYYWPNVTRATEEEAWEWAIDTLGYAFKEAALVMSGWNVSPA